MLRAEEAGRDFDVVLEDYRPPPLGHHGRDPIHDVARKAPVALALHHALRFEAPVAPEDGICQDILRHDVVD